jgi:hypothetical protein
MTKTLSKKIFLIAIVGLMVTVFCMPMAVTLAKTDGMPNSLNGNKIGCYYDHSMSLPANEPCYVIHGFATFNWKDVTPQERQSLLSKDTVFVLYIDGVQVDLRKSQQFMKSYDSPEYGLQVDAMLKLFYVQFPAGYFAAGQTYVFHGMWYSEGTLQHEGFTTVTFT